MITVMTPTFNRAYILPKLYDSLINQTSYDFEWIVIDDGSTDNTGALFADWLKRDNPFEITYIKKENGGKHRAVNNAVIIAKYDWFFIVDSDDYLATDAIVLVHEWIKTVDGDNTFAGVSGLRGCIGNNEIIGEYPTDEQYEEFIDATNLQRREKHLDGDKAEVYKTDILRKYPFPEFEGENFIAECAVWDKIALDGYKIRWFNKVIYKCDYLKDGLSNIGDRLLIDNSEGFAYNIKMQFIIFPHSNESYNVHKYYYIAKEKGLKSKDISKKLGIPNSKLKMLVLKQNIINILRKNKTLFNGCKKIYKLLVNQSS